MIYKNNLFFFLFVGGGGSIAPLAFLKIRQGISAPQVRKTELGNLIEMI